MRKPSESVFCSYVMAHYGIFVLIARETHLKRWYNVTAPLEERQEHYGCVSEEPITTQAVTIIP